MDRSEADIKRLAKLDTVPHWCRERTIFLGLEKFSSARKLIDAGPRWRWHGLQPGSSPTASMRLCYPWHAPI